MLRPFFPFYGAKWRSARLYGVPRHGLVVEPFAGSASYATYWEPPHVVLIDADPIIAGVWSYLIHVTEREVSALPDLDVGQDVRDLAIPQEAQWLIGYWLNRGSALPKRTRTAYSARTERSQLVWGARARERLASQVGRIRHWRVSCGDYRGVVRDRPIVATWFIDPPYTDKGRFYRMANVDYSDIARWAKARAGQVIVCENSGAEWLPFTPLATTKSTTGVSEEVVWCQES